MEKKVFSVNDVDGYLEVENGDIYLDTKEGSTVATTSEIISKNNPDIYLLPSTLIRTPKTDEELAEEKYPAPCDGGSQLFIELRKAWLLGRHSFGDKKFHLNEEQVNTLIHYSRAGQFNNSEWKFTKDELIASLTPPIYPHTITVDFEDGIYYFETLKAKY